MIEDAKLPEPAIGSGRLLCYARVPESMEPGPSQMRAGAGIIGAVPALAIYATEDSAEVVTLHCSADWKMRGADFAPSLDAAKRAAERLYPGIGARWIASPYSDEEADAYRRDGRATVSFDGAFPGRGDRPDPTLPEPAIWSGRLLCYARVPDSVEFSGNGPIWVRGERLGAAPALALYGTEDEAEIVILHCAEDWEELGTDFAPSLDEAKRAVERLYPGIGAHWVPSPYTDDEADAYRRRGACSFCGRTIYDCKQMFTADGVVICDACVRDFYAELAADGDEGER